MFGLTNMDDSSNNPDNLPETEVLSAKVDQLQKAADATLDDDDIEEYVRLDHEHQKTNDQYLLAKEKEREKRASERSKDE